MARVHAASRCTPRVSERMAHIIRMHGTGPGCGLFRGSVDGHAATLPSFWKAKAQMRDRYSERRAGAR